MDLTVSLENGENLSFSASLPPNLIHHQVLPMAFVASGKWGSLIYQILKTDDYTLSYCTYLIKEHTSFLLRSTSTARALHISLKNDFTMESEGLGYSSSKEEQFNLAFLPRVHSKLPFTPGVYKGFCINYGKEYLERFIPYLPVLKDLLNNIDIGISSRLSTTPLYTTSSMLGIIKNILCFEHTDKLSPLYIESEIFTLLTLAIKVVRNENARTTILPQADRAKIEDVKDWLIANIYEHGSLRDIARKFGINEHKLKKNFKDAFGTTVFDFLLTKRMENAHNMLLETNIPITEIAYLSGYNSGSHFTDAFRRHYGYSPNQLRKRQ